MRSLPSGTLIRTPVGLIFNSADWASDGQSGPTTLTSCPARWSASGREGTVSAG